MNKKYIVFLVSSFFLVGCTDNVNAQYNGGPTHFVTFNSNYGTFVQPQEVIENKLATRPDNPTRDGYYFGGWFIDSTFENEFSFSTPIKQDLNLYARWDEVETYQLAFQTVDCDVVGYFHPMQIRAHRKELEFTVIAKDGYFLNDISMMHKNVDFDLSSDLKTAKLTINDMDENINIRLTATKHKSIDLNYNLQNCTIEGQDGVGTIPLATGTDKKQFHIAPKDGYAKPTLGSDLQISSDNRNEYEYDNDSGILTITKLVGFIRINCSARVGGYHIEIYSQNGSIYQKDGDTPTHLINYYTGPATDIQEVIFKPDEATYFTNSDIYCYTEDSTKIDFDIQANIDGTFKISFFTNCNALINLSGRKYKHVERKITFNPGTGNNKYFDVLYNETKIDGSLSVTCPEDSSVLNIATVVIRPKENTYYISDNFSVINSKGEKLNVLKEKFNNEYSYILSFNLNQDITINVEELSFKALEEYDWISIQNICDDGNATKAFKIGDTKSINFSGGKEGHKVRIIGFNQDKKSNDSTCAITFEFTSMLTQEDGDAIRESWAPRDFEGGYPPTYTESLIAEKLDAFGSHLSGEIDEYVRPIMKKTYCKDPVTHDISYQTNYLRFFLLSTTELGCDTGSSYYESREEATPYEYYDPKKYTQDELALRRIKKLINSTTNLIDDEYMTRTVVDGWSEGSSGPALIDKDGKFSNMGEVKVTYPLTVAFAFA